MDFRGVCIAFLENPLENHQILYVLSNPHDIVVQAPEYPVLNPLIDVPALHKENSNLQHLIPRRFNNQTYASRFKVNISPAVYTAVIKAKPKATEAKQAVAVALKEILSILFTPVDAYNMIKYPLTTETVMKKIEDNKTLIIFTPSQANTNHAEAVRKLYGIVVAERLTFKLVLMVTRRRNAFDSSL
uniref:Uncharacterized protein n=1 Tax=Glossina palpalis gambiensis TaxID=67801 RepID=A0A1B0B544_9MUSC